MPDCLHASRRERIVYTGYVEKNIRERNSVQFYFASFMVLTTNTKTNYSHTTMGTTSLLQTVQIVDAVRYNLGTS